MNVLGLEIQLGTLNARIEDYQQTLADLKAERARMVGELAEMKKGRTSADLAAEAIERLHPPLPPTEGYVPPEWREVGK